MATSHSSGGESGKMKGRGQHFWKVVGVRGLGFIYLSCISLVDCACVCVFVSGEKQERGGVVGGGGRC